MTSDYRAPDPYANDIAKIHAATSTPMSRFEEEYKAERMREITAQHTEWSAQRPAQQPTPRLTGAQLATYVPPDIYALAKENNR